MHFLETIQLDINAKWLDQKYVSWENMLHEEVANVEFTEIF